MECSDRAGHYKPPVDLDSPQFDEVDYRKLCKEASSPDGNYPDLSVEGKYLYIRTSHEQGTDLENQRAWKLWIPRALTESVIRKAHDVVTSAHGGMAKTLELLRRNFFWPGMIIQVRDYMRNCDDHMSKFHWLCPLKKFNTAPIQEFLQNQIFLTYGVPYCIVSDNGVQFKSKDFNAWLTSLGIRQL